MYVCTHCMYACMYVCTCIYKCVCVYILYIYFIYTYIVYACMYVCMYVCRTHIRTYTYIVCNVMYIIHLFTCILIRTFRDSCGSYVQFRASKDGQKLVIVNMSTDHNHPVTKVRLCLNYMYSMPIYT